MMNSGLIKALVLAGCIFSTCAFSKIQIPYENDAQVMGAALNSLTNSLPMVSNTMLFCVNEDPGFSKRGEAVIGAWHTRNDKYLPLRPILLSEMRAQALSEGKEAWWNEFESVTMPKQNELMGNSLINHLKTLPEGDQRKSMCEVLAKSIDGGSLDITNEDPKVAAFLNQRLELLQNSKN